MIRFKIASSPVTMRVSDAVVIGTGAVDPYEGAYVVIPKITDQTLDTERKLMLQDLLVKQIPFYDVSNAAGGSTIFIGSEV